MVNRGRRIDQAKAREAYAAIRRECKWCNRETPDNCTSRCALNKKTSPKEAPQVRIAAYCRQVCPGFPCIDGDQLHIVGTRERCWLFPFRHGRIPRRAA